MKVTMELVGNVAELAGMHPITRLIVLIVKAASTARKNDSVCHKFAQWLEMIERLLKPLLKIPDLMEHPETSEPLKQLEESLQQAYQLVIKYKDRSYPYRFIMGLDIVERFREARDEIKYIIDLIPLIKLFVNETIRPVDTYYQESRTRRRTTRRTGTTRSLPGVLDKYEKYQKKGKNKEQKGNRENKKKAGKEESEKVKEKERGKRKEMEKMKENWREEDRRKGKDEKKKNVPPAGLELCEDCLEPIKSGIFNYPGVEQVAMNKLFLRVPVVVNVDAKTLHERDYVAKNTNREVDLISKRGRERDDYQVFEKMGKDNKSIRGERKPKGSNNNKKCVMVVLKVSGTGLQCDCIGCKYEIQNGLSKIRDLTGVEHVGIDKDNNQVIVTGTTMGTKTLRETLSKSLHPRRVEVHWSEMMNGKD